MKIKIVKSDDIDQARETHQLGFPGDKWVGDDHEYWFAVTETGEVVGFASAKFFAAERVAYLSRAAVVRRAAHSGLQRRLIRVRVAWARREGAKIVVTYAHIRNFKSIVNLIRSGFRFIKPPASWKNFHCFGLVIEPRARLKFYDLLEYQT